MPRRRLESAPWQTEREYRWTCPACGREIVCRSDQQCAGQIMMHIVSHDALIPLVAKCISEIEKRIKEMYSGELKL